MRPLLLLSILVLAGVSPPAGQTKPATTDEKEIAAYELTLPTLKKVEAAVTNLMTTLADDPRSARAQTLEQEIDALEEKDELTDADAERLEKLRTELAKLEGSSGDDVMSGTGTLSEMAARIDKHPGFSKALKSAGLSAREYVTFMAAFLQASMAHGFQKAGTIKELPKDINPANIKFIEAHYAE
ncbi:MAG: hypothetical protein LC791_12970, partial [Acidobacteria bacterium]|nr:hypothetical protein [Acidobacteriota bacterium]